VGVGLGRKIGCESERKELLVDLKGDLRSLRDCDEREIDGEEEEEAWGGRFIESKRQHRKWRKRVTEDYVNIVDVAFLG